MCEVVRHIGQRFNTRPRRIAARENNKPSLSMDLFPSLKEKHGELADHKLIVSSV
jgi:hypothetical protein